MKKKAGNLLSMKDGVLEQGREAVPRLHLVLILGWAAVHDQAMSGPREQKRACRMRWNSCSKADVAPVPFACQRHGAAGPPWSPSRTASWACVLRSICLLEMADNEIRTCTSKP